MAGALELTVAKNLSNNFQVMVGINRQWQQFGGTWNPTDPARVHPAGHVPERHAALHAARQQRGEQPADHDRHDGSHLRSDLAGVLAALRRHLSRAVRRDAGGQLHDSGRARGRDRSSISCRSATRSSRSSARRTLRWRTGRRRAIRCPPACGSSTRRAAKARCRRRPIKTLGLKLGKTVKLGRQPRGRSSAGDLSTC